MVENITFFWCMFMCVPYNNSENKMIVLLLQCFLCCPENSLKITTITHAKLITQIYVVPPFCVNPLVWPSPYQSNGGLCCACCNSSSDYSYLCPPPPVVSVTPCVSLQAHSVSTLPCVSFIEQIQSAGNRQTIPYTNFLKSPKMAQAQVDCGVLPDLKMELSFSG